MNEKPLSQFSEQEQREIERAAGAVSKSLSEESDRGLVLVGVSLLDEQVEALLRARFCVNASKPQSVIEPLFEPFGPLATFSGKTRIAYAFDLFQAEWIYRDLELLRKLRNRFAHGSRPAQFDAADVVALTEKLQAADYAATQIGRSNTGKAELESPAVPGTTAEHPMGSKKAAMERSRVVTSMCFLLGALFVATRDIGILERCRGWGGDPKPRKVN